MSITPNGKLWLITIAVWIAVVVAMLLSTGCASVEYQDHQGMVIKRKSWIWSTSKIAGFQLTIDTNGMRTIRFEQYSTESDESIRLIIDAAARGAAEALRAYRGQVSAPSGTTIR